MKNIVETFNLTKIYKDRIVAVDNLNLKIRKGEIFGLLGPNGAGKTTTVRMLTTFLKPTSGNARIFGYNLVEEAAKVREIIGYSAQETGIDRNATGRENLMLFGRYHHLNGRLLQKRVKELLKLVGLEEVADRLARTYSSGMRKRLEIATALVHDPEILFLDEPTLGLDVQTRMIIWNYIRKLREDGITVILTTHYLEEADKLCDRLAIIDHGKIIALGTPNMLKKKIKGDSVSLTISSKDSEKLTVNMKKAKQALLDQPFVKDVKSANNRLVVYVGEGESAIPKIVRLLEKEGLSVETITFSRPSLDDVFLEYTGRSLRTGGESHEVST